MVGLWNLHKQKNLNKVKGVKTPPAKVLRLKDRSPIQKLFFSKTLISKIIATGWLFKKFEYKNSHLANILTSGNFNNLKNGANLGIECPRAKLTYKENRAEEELKDKTSIKRQNNEQS